MASIHAGAPEDWDMWIARHSDRAGFRQSTGWAAVASVLNATKFYFLDVREGGERLAGVMAGHVPLAVSVRRPMTRAFLRTIGRGGGTLEIGNGPVLAGAMTGIAFNKLLETVDSLAARLGVSEIRVTNAPPPLSGDMETRSGMAGFGYQPQEWRTALIDLTRSESDLHRRIRQAARKGIRKAREAGLTVDVFSAAGTAALAALFQARLAAGDRKKPVYDRIVATLRADAAGAYRFFVAHNPALGIVAALGTCRFDGTASEIASLRGVAKAAQRLPAQDLLHWEAFRHHRALGDVCFDLAGYSPAPRDAKEAGIRRFKEKWCGVEQTTWNFSKTLRPDIWNAFRLH